MKGHPLNHFSGKKLFKDISWKRFSSLAQKFGYSLTEEKLEKFKTYHRLLLEWGEKINLYSRNDRNRLLAYHFLDSLIPINLIPEKASLADIGSGAGFPAIPIKIMRPDLNCFLFESKKKKAIFLFYTVKSLGLSDIAVIDKRVEETKACNSPLRFDVLTIRLLGEIKEVIPLISHLLKENSRIIFYKGGNLKRELEEGGGMMKRLGISLEGIHTFHLSWLRLTRKILIFRKVVY